MANFVEKLFKDQKYLLKNDVVNSINEVGLPMKLGRLDFAGYYYEK